MNNYTALGLFLAFVVASYRTSRLAAGAVDRRRYTNAFIALALILSFSAGLLQRDFYPFCQWPLVAGVLPDGVFSPRIALVASDGTEHDVDYRIWVPLAIDELNAWIDGRFQSLSSRDRREVAAWLLQHADSARRAILANGRVTELGSLGPISAPYFLQHKRIWSDVREAPTYPFVAIRFYRDRWSIAGRARGLPIRHDLFYEYDTRTARELAWRSR